MDSILFLHAQDSSKVCLDKFDFTPSTITRCIMTCDDPRRAWMAFSPMKHVDRLHVLCLLSCAGHSAHRIFALSELKKHDSVLSSTFKLELSNKLAGCCQYSCLLKVHVEKTYRNRMVGERDLIRCLDPVPYFKQWCAMILRAKMRNVDG